MATVEQRFINAVRQDIHHFEQVAELLESLMPALSAGEEQERARTFAQKHRHRADELRHLLDSVKSAGLMPESSTIQ
jgi:cupin superfamily acireductone dioxygenase involved in methionine salvage